MEMERSGCLTKTEKREGGSDLKKMFQGVLLAVLSLLSLAFCIILICGTVFGFMGYRMYKDAVNEVPLEEKVASIQSMDGFTEYEQLPQIYIDAVVSVEDRRFWSHNGIDPIAIGRAAWNDIRTLSFAEGGSTITQQLMKNLYFTQEKKLERKFAEIFAAFEMESAYNKEEIFELYVNTIYFGSGYYGIYEASQGYFGKQPSDLNDYEAVLLAGLPNAPSAYSLYENPELAKQRMRQVLSCMVSCEKITQDRADELLS